MSLISLQLMDNGCALATASAHPLLTGCAAGLLHAMCIRTNPTETTTLYCRKWR